ncbi:MAG: phosphotransferase [Acidimicrobiales bacterium]
MTFSDHLVRDAVAAAGLGKVRTLVPAGAGERNEVVIVESDGGPVVVRLLVDDTRLAMETALLAIAAHAGVPVAEVLWSAETPRPVMIQRRLPGRRLGDTAPSEGLCASAADVLRRIHAIPIEEGFGNLQANLQGQTAMLSEWFVDVVAAEVEAALASPIATIAPDDARLLETSVARLANARSLLDRQPTGLAHGDFHAYNLLADGNRITGVLDWEAAKSGPPALDFGWWDWFTDVWGNPWPTDRLLHHYDPDGRLDREELSALRSLVVRRVWTRELISGLRSGDAKRAEAARQALSG